MSRSLLATPTRRWSVLVPALVLGLSLLSCGREITGPEGGLRTAAFALDPQMPAPFAVEGSGDVVPFDRVRVTLTHLDGALARPAVIVPFTPATDTVELGLTLELPFGTTDEGIQVILNMQYINAAGDTVFRAGPQTVTALPSSEGEPPPVVPVTVTYTGPGSNAATVVLTQPSATVVSGTTTSFTASALDGQGNAIPNSPVIFSSPDVTRVTITAAGVATWLPVRGNARIIATLPTGVDADTVSFTVALPATKLAIVSGNGQNATAGSALPSAVVLRVTADDDVPVPGVTVTFTPAANNGSVVPTTAVSDANGLVSTNWTLGTALGAQVMTATYPGLVGGPRTINANSQALPAANISVVSGNAQVGGPAAALPLPLVVRVTDAQGGGVVGATVTFTVAAGGGSVAPTTAVTDATGHAQTSWTLGATGAQGVDATTTGVQGVANFTATFASSGVVTWTGAVSNDWNVGGNWQGGTVPTVTDSVVIPAVATQPHLTATPTLVGSLNVSAGTLLFNGHTLATLRDFATTGSGVIVMQDENDALSVGRHATFAGGNESGLLTQGGMTVAGNFTQLAASSGSSFQPGRGFVTVLSSQDPVVSFATPGDENNGSYFGNLAWTGSGTFTLNSGVAVVGTYVSTSATPARHLGTGTVGRFLAFENFSSVAPALFERVRVTIGQETISTAVTLSNATFRNMPTTLPQLSVHVSGASPVTIDNVVFETVPTGAGLYMTAMDRVPTDGMPLVVNVSNATPATPGGFISVNDGATINWPAGSSRLWLGQTSDDWTTASNWFPVGAPGPLDDVTIPAGVPNLPTLLTAATISDLLVHTGATLTISTGILTVNGDITSNGTVVVDAFNGALRANGTGRTVRGNITNLDVRGAYSLSGSLTVTGSVFSRGSLNIAGNTLTIGTDLMLLSAGVIVMQDADDQVVVTNQALFTGGSTEGLMTNGLLQVGGRLLQNNSGTGNPSNSFAPSGNHTTRLVHTAFQDVDIFNTGPGAGFSHFANLDLSGHTGTVTLLRDQPIYVTGTLTSLPAGPVPTVTTSLTASLHANAVNVNGLRMLSTRLTIGGGTFTRFDDVLFNNFQVGETQLRIDHPGRSTPLVMNDLVFSTTPTTGFYISANDTDGPTPNALRIDLNAATPGTPGTRTEALNGAVISWPAAAPVRVWEGDQSTSWTSPANWAGGVVPTAGDSVFVPSGTPLSPQLAGATTIAGFRMEGGTSLNLNGHLFTVNGPLDAPVGSAFPGGGSIALGGIGMVRGQLPTTTITGTYTVGLGGLEIDGDLHVSAGLLNIGGNNITVNGEFRTQGTGVLEMTGGGNATVTGSALFGGGNTDGLLTAGTLFVGDIFAQLTNPTAFRASGTHVVHLNSPDDQSITFANPDITTSTTCATSCFATVRATGTGGINVLTDFKAIGGLDFNVENVFGSGRTVIAGGGTSMVSTGIVDLAMLGFQSSYAPTIANDQIDSLTIWGNGVAIPGNLDKPLRVDGFTIMSASHNAGMLVTGGIEIAGRVSIGGNFQTSGAGRVTMQQATDTLIIIGTAAFGGQIPINQMTAGVLEIQGSLIQNRTGDPSLRSEGTHKIRLTGATPLISFVEPANNFLNDVEFATTGMSQITTDLVVNGNVIVRTTSGMVSANAGTTVTIAGGLYDTLGTRWNAPTTRFVGVNPVLPNTVGTPGSVVEFTQNVALTHDVTFPGTLLVGGTAELALNGNRVSVLGPFATVTDGRVRMDNPADTLSLSANASFNGFSTAGVMTAGTLELYGNLLQTGNPASFSASGTHQTLFLGTGVQTVTFANPGASPTNSHFNDVVLAQGTEGVSVRLATDVFANGQLISRPTAARRISAIASQLFHSGGAAIGATANVEFDNVRWALMDGAAVAVDGVRFQNMDAAAIQFSILRAGPTMTLANLDFATVPTTGEYMRVEDSDGAANGNLVVTIAGVTPAIHNGFLEVIAPATVVGWLGAPDFRWTGVTSSDWATASNWSSGIVPGATDSVFITASTPNTPTVNVADTVRTLVLDDVAGMLLLENLWVLGTVDVPPTSSIGADGGQLILSSATGGTLRGAMPSIEIRGGTYTLVGPTAVGGNLYIYGDQLPGPAWTEGNVIVGPHNLTISGGLFTGQEGAFTMTGTGVVDVADWVNFFGNSTAGRMTNGILRVGGDFDQDSTDASPQSFHATLAHVVELAGPAARQRIRMRGGDSLVTPGCVSSCFATLRSVKTAGQGGVVIEGPLKVMVGLNLQADSVIARNNEIIAVGTPVFTTPNLVVGALAYQSGFTIAGDLTPTVDSLVAWGNGFELQNLAGVRTVVKGNYFLDNSIPGSIQVDPTGSLTLDQTLSINGDLVLNGGTAGVTASSPAADIQIIGNLVVQGTGHYLSSGAAHLTTVMGSATFNGADATGDLSTGRLRVNGAFSQLATNSPSSFAPAAAFITEFVGSGSINFATPGPSSFGQLHFATPSVTRTLASDMTVQRMLDITAGAVTLTSGTPGAGGSRRITADSVNSTGALVAFTNVALTTSVFTTSSGLSFNGFDPAVVQLDIVAPTATASTMQNVTFATVPSGAGRYVRIADATPTGGDGSPSMTVTAPIAPAFHGGHAEVIAPATLAGWDATADFTWTGAIDSNWSTAANWADGIVPTAADSVHVPEVVNAPQLPEGGVTVRAFTSVRTSGSINISEPFTVTERLAVPALTGISCDGGSLLLAAGATPVAIEGRIACFTRVTAGTAVASGDVSIEGNDLQVEGSATFDVGGQTVVVGQNFSTMGAGRLRMVNAADTLIVTEGATFGGGATIGMLSAGVLEVRGNFTQNGVVGSFAASGTHKTILMDGCFGDCGVRQAELTDAVFSRFANLEIRDGRRRLNSNLHALANILVMASAQVDTSSLATGAGLLADSDLTAEPGSTVEVGLTHVGGVLNVPAAYDTREMRFVGTGQLIPARVYRTLVVYGTASIRSNLSVIDSLVISGGQLNFGEVGDIGLSVTVNGGLRTQTGGRLRMVEPTSTLYVLGPATFAGGSTDGLLLGGFLLLRGNPMTLTVAGGVGDAFAASPGHITKFEGDNSGTVFFANPGLGAGQSHFGSLEIGLTEGGTSVNLLSNLFASGQLVAGVANSKQFSAASPFSITSTGADVVGMTLSNVNWRLLDGTAVENLAQVSFINMDVASEQFAIERPQGSFSMQDATFGTMPTSGRYLRLTDTNTGDGNFLTLTMVNPNPPSHGGFVQVGPAATLLGWPEAALFTWTGSTSGAWQEPTNWDRGLVPGALDSALFTPSFSVQPFPNGVITVGTVINQMGESMILAGGQLNIRRGLDLDWLGNNITCDGGIVNFQRGTAGPIAFDGLIQPNCTVRVREGSLSITDSASVGNLEVQDGGELVVNGETMYINGTLSTFDRSRLNMQNAEGILFVTGNVSVNGLSTDGVLTAGRLVILGSFAQQNAQSVSSFRATGAHVTEFLGAQSTSTVSFATPDATQSTFATVEFRKAGGNLGFLTPSFALNSDFISGAMSFSPGAPGASLTVANTAWLRSPSTITIGSGAFVNVLGTCNPLGAGISGPGTISPNCTPP